MVWRLRNTSDEYQYVYDVDIAVNEKAGVELPLQTGLFVLISSICLYFSA